MCSKQKHIEGKLSKPGSMCFDKQAFCVGCTRRSCFWGPWRLLFCSTCQKTAGLRDGLQSGGKFLIPCFVWWSGSSSYSDSTYCTVASNVPQLPHSTHFLQLFSGTKEIVGEYFGCSLWLLSITWAVLWVRRYHVTKTTSIHETTSLSYPISWLQSSC